MRISPRGRRALTIVLVGLTLAYLTYVAAVFAALRWGALEALTRDSRDAHVASQGGHSFWPTRIVLKDARFGFKDYNIEMVIEAREAVIRWSPLALFAKRIQIQEFRAQGARYKMLHRVKHLHPNRERVAAFPDTGFSRSKIYDSPSPPYSVPPFRVRVEKIVADVEEAWILEYRAVGGQIEATGGFELHEDVIVFPSRATFRDARIFLGEKSFASRVDCDLRARIGPFPGREPLDAALGTTDGKTDCRMTLDDLSALRVYFPDSPVVLEGRGELTAQVQLAQGQARSSHLQVDARVERLGVERGFLAGNARLVANVAETGQSRLTVSFQGDPAPTGPVEIRLAEVEVLAEQPKLVSSKLSAATLQLASLEVRDPTLLRQMAALDEAPLVKVARANLGLSYIARKADVPGKLEMESQGALAWFPQVDVAISCDHQATVRCKLEDDATSCPGGTLECTPLTVDLSRERSGSLHATLRANTLELTPERTTSEWSLSLGNPESLVRAALSKNFWTDLGLALAPLGPVEGRGHVNVRERTIAGMVDDVHSGPFSARGGFMLATGAVSRWRVTTPLGRFGISQTPSGTEITPFVSGDWDVLAFNE